MNYQKKLTEIENAQKSLILLKREILSADRKTKKMFNIENSFNQTEKNALEVYKQIYKLNKQLTTTWRTLLKINL